MKGARKAPASAPHEMPMSWAMKVGGFRAIISERTMKKTMRTRITTTLRDAALFHLAGQRFLVAVDEVEGHRARRCQHQRGQRAHRGGQHQQHDEGDEHVGQRHEHGRDDAVKGNLAGGLIDDRLIETAEAAEEVAATGHDEGENGGDDGAALDGALVGDAVELTHHLRQTHRAQRGQDDHAQQPPRIGTEPRGEAAIDRRVGIRGQRRQLPDSRSQTALSIQHRHDDSHDAEEHDDSLYEVVHGRSLVAAEDDIDGREDGHNDDAVLIGNIESHLKKTRDAAIDTGGVRNQEHEGDDGGADAQTLVLKAGAKEIRHRAALDVLRHQLGATA